MDRQTEECGARAVGTSSCSGVATAGVHVLAASRRVAAMLSASFFFLSACHIINCTCPGGE